MGGLRRFFRDEAGTAETAVMAVEMEDMAVVMVAAAAATAMTTKAFRICKFPGLLAKVVNPASPGKVSAGERAGGTGMNGPRRFFREETATAETTAMVVMIAAVGVLLVAGLAVWYGALNGSFNTMANSVNTLKSVIPSGS